MPEILNALFYYIVIIINMNIDSFSVKLVLKIYAQEKMYKFIKG